MVMMPSCQCGGCVKEKPVFSLNLMGLSCPDLDTDPENLDSIFLTACFDWRWMCSGRDAAHLLTRPFYFSLLLFIVGRFALLLRSCFTGLLGTGRCLIHRIRKSSLEFDYHGVCDVKLDPRHCGKNLSGGLYIPQSSRSIMLTVYIGPRMCSSDAKTCIANVNEFSTTACCD